MNSPAPSESRTSMRSRTIKGVHVHKLNAVDERHSRISGVRVGEPPIAVGRRRAAGAAEKELVDEGLSGPPIESTDDAFGRRIHRTDLGHAQASSDIRDRQLDSGGQSVCKICRRGRTTRRCWGIPTQDPARSKTVTGRKAPVFLGTLTGMLLNRPMRAAVLAHASLRLSPFAI